MKRMVQDKIALMTMYGTEREVEYVGVVIQTAPIDDGGEVIAYQFFDLADYPDARAIADAVAAYADRYGVKTMYKNGEGDELFPPEYCERCECGERAYRKLDRLPV